MIEDYINLKHKLDNLLSTTDYSDPKNPIQVRWKGEVINELFTWLDEKIKETK